MTRELITDIVQWDIKSWQKALAYWESRVAWDEVRNGLELGGNRGGLSLWLALKGKETVCSDLEDVRKTAEPLHLKYGVTSLITYQDIDASRIPYEDFFDVVVFKSIIGGIGRGNNKEIQKQVFREAYKALKPGGKLLFAENLIASPLHQQLRKRFVQWGDSWRYVSLEEMREFLGDFSSYELKTTGIAGTFGRNERQRNLLAAADQYFLNAVSPAKWKYIAYGIAVK